MNLTLTTLVRVDEFSKSHASGKELLSEKSVTAVNNIADAQGIPSALYMLTPPTRATITSRAI